ncbi:MAG: pyridoxamine 5'-phosphate oxidase family protein [Desulfobacter sp.]|nr:MAG: pyridoxamine 5'-phosphate oxidase family protein [Desulfobacter sp.]
MPGTRTTFKPEEIQAFMPEEKIGIVASVNSEGLPHISLITSIRAAGPSQITLGEFCKGKSKENIQQNKKAGFLIMTMDKRMWRGKANWTHLKQDGPEFEAYNLMPMFRYNAYFGINTVHYLDLLETSAPEPLPLGRVIWATLLTRLVKGARALKEKQNPLNPFSKNLFNQMDALKFISWIPDDGFPVIVPVFQCQAADSGRIVFSSSVYKKELSAIPPGTTVAVFAMNMKMEDVLIRGKFSGLTRSRLITLGQVDIDWVYNSMPPCHGQIYPQIPVKPIVNF